MRFKDKLIIGFITVLVGYQGIIAIGLGIHTSNLAAFLLGLLLLSNVLYQFKSSRIYADPILFLHTDLKILVYINPQKPKEYYMDINSIPNLAYFLKHHG